MKDSVIIGYGPAGVITTQRILETHPQSSLTIYDSGLRSHAFIQKTDAFLLNTKVQDMNVSEQYPFQQFLEERGVKRESDFVPRYHYGAYLDHFRQQHRTDPRIKIITRQIELDSPELNGKQLFCCNGGMKHKALRIDPKKLFEYPWDMERLASIPPGSSILFVGTSLSFIDVLNFIKEGNHRITAISRTKARIQPHLPNPVALDKDLAEELIKTNTLRAFVKIFRRLSDSERYAAVKIVRTRQGEVWRNFSLREKNQFQKWVAPYWRVNRHRAPLSTLAMVSELEQSGRLRFVQSSLSRQNLQNYDYIINTTGFSLPQDPHLHQDTDHHYQCKNGMYVVGPANSPNHFESNSVPDFIQQATVIARHWKGVI